MTDYTDNDGNPIGQRFFTDPECPKRIFDAAIDSYDQSMAMEVVGWWPDGDASRYADEIAAMLNEVEALRRDAERWRKHAARMGKLARKLREPDWHIESIREFQRELASLEEAAIAAEKEATK